VYRPSDTRIIRGGEEQLARALDAQDDMKHSFRSLEGDPNLADISHWLADVPQEGVATNL